MPRGTERIDDSYVKLAQNSFLQLDFDGSLYPLLIAFQNGRHHLFTGFFFTLTKVVSCHGFQN